MAIKARGGLSSGFDKNKLVGREFAVVTDTGEVYVCFSAGNVKKIATQEDIATVLNTSPTAYSALVQCVTDLQNNPSQLTNILNNISALQSGKIDKTSIADDLATNDASKVLSAKQGKALNDNLALTSGTWTPAIEGSTTPGANTYGARNGKYYRVGKLVWISFDITVTTKDAAMAGILKITGLPFVVASNVVGGPVFFMTNVTIPSGYTGVQLYSEIDLNYLRLSAIGSNTNYKMLTAAELNNGAIIRGSMVYLIN